VRQKSLVLQDKYEREKESQISYDLLTPFLTPTWPVLSLFGF
jgi:hypothetical protein